MPTIKTLLIINAIALLLFMLALTTLLKRQNEDRRVRRLRCAARYLGYLT